MEPIKQDFPGNGVVEYYLLSADNVNPGAVVMEDNLKPTISFEFEVGITMLLRITSNFKLETKVV